MSPKVEWSIGSESCRRGAFLAHVRREVARGATSAHHQELEIRGERGRLKLVTATLASMGFLVR